MSTNIDSDTHVKGATQQLTQEIESSTRMVGEAVLFKRGQTIPPNAIPLTEPEVLAIQERRIEKFQPPREMRTFNYAIYCIGATTGICGAVIATTMRRNFRLGGLRRGFVYGPSILLPAVCSGIAQDMTIRRGILMGREQCPTCVAVKGGALQLGLGFFYPYLMSLLTCVPSAREYYTLPFPGKGDGSSYIRLLRQVSPKSQTLLSLALINFTIGSYIAGRQVHVFATHLSSPPSKVKEYLSEQQELME